MNPLTTVKWPLILGFALAVLIAALIGHGLTFNSITLAALTRWLHIIFGVFWIGLLYYFNAVQTPGMAAAAADKGGPGGAGVNKYIAPRALLWFRWSALGTWLLGAYLLSQTPGRFFERIYPWARGRQYSRPNLHHRHRRLVRHHHAFNAWGSIWPNQKKSWGSSRQPTTEGQSRKVALYASRINFLLSIPMLMCMVGPMHGLPF